MERLQGPPQYLPERRGNPFLPLSVCHAHGGNPIFFACLSVCMSRSWKGRVLAGSEVIADVIVVLRTCS